MDITVGRETVQRKVSVLGLAYLVQRLKLVVTMLFQPAQDASQRACVADFQAIHPGRTNV